MRARLLLVALALAAAVVGCVAAAEVVGTASNQCDNMAGTCLRERQQLAILVVRMVCVVAAALPLGVLAAVLAGRVTGRRRAVAVVVLVACAAVGVAALVAQPVDHLDDRWGGWLAG